MPEASGKQAASERRLGTILAAVVAGYSALIKAHEEETIEAAQPLWNSVVAPMDQGAEGRIVRTMGDGILADFPSAVPGLSAQTPRPFPFRGEIDWNTYRAGLVAAGLSV